MLRGEAGWDGLSVSVSPSPRQSILLMSYSPAPQGGEQRTGDPGLWEVSFRFTRSADQDVLVKKLPEA